MSEFAEDGRADEQQSHTGSRSQVDRFLERVDTLSKTEAQMPLGIIRPGDLIGIQYGPEDARKGLLFDVNTLAWKHLGLGNTPDPEIVGRLSGVHIPSSFTDADAYFVGSSFSGSMVRHGRLATGESASFQLVDDVREEFHTTGVNNFEVLRPSGTGEYTALEPQQLEAQVDQEMLSLHQVRLQQIRQLLGAFDIDLATIDDFIKEKDGSFFGEDIDQLQRMTRHNDENVAIVVEPRGIKKSDVKAALHEDQDQTGITIYDKVHNIMVRCLKSEESNSLKISYVDLNDGGYQKLDEAIRSSRRDRTTIDDATIGDDDIYRSDLPITTFTTSGRYGIAAIDYMVSPDDAREYWDIPVPRNLSLHDIHLQIWPDGRITFDPRSDLGHSKEEESKTKQGILDTVSVDQLEDGSSVLHLNGRDVSLHDPEKILTAIIPNPQS